MRDPVIESLLFWIGLAVSLGLGFAGCAGALVGSVAHAQECRTWRTSEQGIGCIIAREVGINARRWERRGRELDTEPAELFRVEAAAIGWALRNRADARHVSLRIHLRSYLGERSFATRLWTAFLRPGRDWQRQPTVWPPGASWARSRPYWRLALEVAVGVESGVIEDPCPRDPSPVEHWGGPCDDHRAEPYLRSGRWERVECGATRNRFYRVRRRR